MLFHRRSWGSGCLLRGANLPCARLAEKLVAARCLLKDITGRGMKVADASFVTKI